MNTYLKYQPPAIQFLAFLAFAGGCFLLASIVSYFFFQDVYAILLDKNVVVTPSLITKFKLAQLVSAGLSFLIPALLFGYYSSPKSLPYIGVQPYISPLLLVAAVALLLSIQPFISYLGYFNAHLNFGKWQQFIDQTEARYDRALKVFLQMPTFGDFITNVLIMALLPAVSEELFFRGAFQKALLRLSNKPWLAILLSATVFAFLHGTMLKLIPIFALGLLLGTIYHVTRNVWYTIIIHFINNAFALIAVYYGNRSEFLRKMTDENTPIPIYFALLSLAAGVCLLYFIRKKSLLILPVVITNEDNDYLAL